MAKKRKKGVIRTLKVILDTDKGKDVEIYKYANAAKSDAEMVSFVQTANLLTTNTVRKIVRRDFEDITDAEPDFEKVEGIAVYNAEGKLITSKMTFATTEDVETMLNGGESETPVVESGTTEWTIAVYDNSKLTDTTITFATVTDIDAMLNDDTPADYANTDGYTLAMITSDGKLADSGVGFATVEDVNNFLRR